MTYTTNAMWNTTETLANAEDAVMNARKAAKLTHAVYARMIAGLCKADRIMAEARSKQCGARLAAVATISQRLIAAAK